MNYKQITFAQILGVSIFASAIPGLGIFLLPLVWVVCGGKYAWGYFGAQLLLSLPQIMQIIFASYAISTDTVPASIHYAAQHSDVSAASSAGQFVHWIFGIPAWERTIILFLLEAMPVFILVLFCAGLFLIMKAGKERLKKRLQPYLRFRLT